MAPFAARAPHRDRLRAPATGPRHRPREYKSPFNRVAT